MAVITKYVVVRNGIELDQEFLVKKEAEAYDKMLDAADNLAAFIKGGGLEISLDDATIDAVSVFLAQNGSEVTRILKGLAPVAAPAPETNAGTSEVGDTEPKRKSPAAKTKGK